MKIPQKTLNFVNDLFDNNWDLDNSNDNSEHCDGVIIANWNPFNEDATPILKDKLKTLRSKFKEVIVDNCDIIIYTT